MNFFNVKREFLTPLGKSMGQDDVTSGVRPGRLFSLSLLAEVMQQVSVVVYVGLMEGQSERVSVLEPVPFRGFSFRSFYFLWVPDNGFQCFHGETSNGCQYITTTCRVLVRWFIGVVEKGFLKNFVELFRDVLSFRIDVKARYSFLRFGVRYGRLR